MSRVGKRTIPVPKGVTVTLEEGAVKVGGPRGNLARGINNDVQVDVQDSGVFVTPKEDTKKGRSYQGLTRTLVANMITGVSQGFVRTLEINGVGYRAEAKLDVLTLTVGYSHPIEYKVPEGISVAVEKNRIVLSGIDKELLGATAAKIRGFKKPEPFKGKGIKYIEEFIQRKAGKSAGK